MIDGSLASNTATAQPYTGSIYGEAAELSDTSPSLGPSSYFLFGVYLAGNLSAYQANALGYGFEF
jgi:hypothetical protein